MHLQGYTKFFQKERTLDYFRYLMLHAAAATAFLLLWFYMSGTRRTGLVCAAALMKKQGLVRRFLGESTTSAEKVLVRKGLGLSGG
jgi:hypothetical protein